MANLFTLEDTGDRYEAKISSEQSPTVSSNYVSRNTNYPKPSTISIGSKSVSTRPLETKKTQSTGIDVVNTFDWTTTPKINQNFPVITPSIRLQEFKLDTSTFAQQMMYLAAAGGDGAAATLNVLDTLNAKIKVALVPSQIKTVKEGVSKIQEFVNSGFDKSPEKYLEPYDGLYHAVPTSFQYNFPYFQNQWRDLSNDFADTYSGQSAPMAQAIVGAAENIVGNLTLPLILTEPGVFIEKPKFYNFSSTGESLTFNFPLLNTLHPEQVSRNYQLLWLLIFQNRPYRKNRVLIDPAVIYRATVPGVRYLHWAYMSGLSVEFLGTRREITLDFPNGPISTIVPEAYNVSITLQSLVLESGNLMLKTANI